MKTQGSKRFDWQASEVFLGALKAQRLGNHVNMELPRPASFEQAVAEITENFPASGGAASVPAN